MSTDHGFVPLRATPINTATAPAIHNNTPIVNAMQGAGNITNSIQITNNMVRVNEMTAYILLLMRTKCASSLPASLRRVTATKGTMPPPSIHCTPGSITPELLDCI